MRGEHARPPQCLVMQPAQPGERARERSPGRRIRPGARRRRGGERGTLRIRPFEPPRRPADRRIRHFARRRHPVAMREEGGEELRIGVRRVDVGGIQQPGAAVQERRVGPHGERLAHDCDVPAARGRPGRGPAGERRAALPVAREPRVEERDLAGGPPAARRDELGERAGHPRLRQVLDGDQDEPRVAEVPVYGRKPRSKLGDVQYVAGSPASTASTFARMLDCVMLTKCLSTVP
jgi:hypothetical protein